MFFGVGFHLFLRFWRKEFFAAAIICLFFFGIFIWFEPIDIRAAGCFSFFAIPSSSGAFFHHFSCIGREENEFVAAFRAFLIKRLCRSVDPFDIIASFCFFRFFIPDICRAFFHFFAKAGDDYYEGTTTLGTFFIKLFWFDFKPFHIVAANILSCVWIPRSC